MIRTNTLLSLLVVMTGLGLATACGKNDFTDAHVNELRKDCTETLACKSGGIEFLASDAAQKCVDAAGAELGDSSDARQQSFIDGVARCSQLQACDYLGCTQADPSVGYASMHGQQIMNECTQTIGCHIASGQAQTTTAVADCVAMTSNTLNVATPQQQQQFEQRATRCAAQTNCAYVACQ